MGKSSSSTVGYKYLLGVHMTLAHGPLDKVISFSVDKRQAWAGACTGGDIVIDAPTLFGGDRREGGVSGTITINMGLPAQTQDAYLLTQLGSQVPAYRGVACAVFQQFYWGNNPYIKEPSFRATRILLTSDGEEQWYPAKASVGTLGTVSNTYRINMSGQFMNYDPPSRTTTGVIAADEGVYFDLDPTDVVMVTPVLDEYIAQNYEPYSAIDGYTWAVFGLFDENPDNHAMKLFAPPGEEWPSMMEAYEAALARSTEWTDLDDPTPAFQFTGHTSVRFWPYMQGAAGVVGPDSGGVSFDVTITSAFDDMNPSHMIRECLTDIEWGLGYSSTDMGSSFTTAADTLYDEGLGMSLLWDKEMPIEDFVNQIGRHIDAAIYLSRATGKFEIKLIRADYNEETLPVFDETNIIKISSPSRAAPGELVNSVTVQYWDAVTGEDASVTVQDPAMVQMMGRVINTTVQYPGFTNRRNATIAAQRDLKSLSSPYLNCTIITGREAKDLNVGDVFVFNWAKWNVSGMVMRVNSISFGNGRNNQIKIVCSEDIYDTPTVVVTGEAGDGWTDPSQPPTAVDYNIAGEIPYYELTQALGQADIDTQLAADPSVGYLFAAAMRNGTVINAKMHVDDGSGYEERDIFDFCAGATLAADVTPVSTSFTYTGGQDLDLVAIGSHLQIDDELCRVDAIDTGTSTITVGRGILDTVPREHSAGALILFWDTYNGYDTTEYVDGESLNVKVTPISGAGELPIGSATADTVVMSSRAVRPYPPGNLLINGESYSDAVKEGVVTVEWADRDRTFQTSTTLYDHTYGDIGPEPGTEYRVRVYLNDVLVVTEEPATSGFTFELDSDGAVQVLVDSLRDTYYSMQAAQHSFPYVSTFFMETEAGDERYTEEGDPRATED